MRMHTEVYAAEAALLFIVFACPLSFRATDATLGRLLLPTATSSGGPTVFGLILHAALFAGLVYTLLSVA